MAKKERKKPMSGLEKQRAGKAKKLKSPIFIGRKKNAKIKL